LIAGGFRESQNPDFSLEPLASAEIYDPDTGRFEPAGESTMLQTTPVLVLLDDGRVLVAGDGSLAFFDPMSGAFRTLEVEPPGIRPTATLLDDSRVLIVGGSDRELLVPAPGPSSHGGGPATRRAVI